MGFLVGVNLMVHRLVVENLKVNLLVAVVNLMTSSSLVLVLLEVNILERLWLGVEVSILVRLLFCFYFGFFLAYLWCENSGIRTLEFLMVDGLAEEHTLPQIFERGSSSPGWKRKKADMLDVLSLVEDDRC